MLCPWPAICSWPVVAIAELIEMDFTRCEVEVKRLAIAHPDPHGTGPWCRLLVSAEVPARSGVYAWVVGEAVQYVGLSKNLTQIVQGQKMGRPYNDYTYVPASQVLNASDPRARVNGLLNAELTAGQQVSWWYLVREPDEAAAELESRLRVDWAPSWNRI